tara:strand:- start:586 stop:849 length:264 start_codon:yes stop_codon:yes gene_type:complete
MLFDVWWKKRFICGFCDELKKKGRGTCESCGRSPSDWDPNSLEFKNVPFEDIDDKHICRECNRTSPYFGDDPCPYCGAIGSGSGAII